MYFVSATRLRVRSIFFLPGFLKANEASVKELLKIAGFKGGKELIDKNLTFWTLTIWNNEADMRIFRNGTAHRKAMQKLPNWCNEAAYVHWLQADVTTPDWLWVHAKILSEGKLTKVRNPSPQQLLKNYPEPKWKRLERFFAVKKTITD